MKLTTTRFVSIFVKYFASLLLLVFGGVAEAQLHDAPSLQNALDGTIIGADTKKIVILIHGWMGKDANDLPAGYDAYQDVNGRPALAYLFFSLKQKLSGSGWKFAPYHWEIDAATGLVDRGDHNFFYGAAVQSAQNAAAHGLKLAAMLKGVAPDLREVHFVAHSAGAWVAREAMRVLLQSNPYVVAQMTLLDPFIPDASFAYNTGLSTSKMNATTSLAAVDRIHRMENYYADELPYWNPTEYLFPTSSTQETFAWRSGIDINQQVDHGILLPALFTVYYDYHSGPLEFYADTVKATIPGESVPNGLVQLSPPFDFLNVGYYKSRQYQSFLLPRIAVQPQSQPVVSGGSVTLGVSADRTVAPTGYTWYKDGVVVGSGPTLSVSQAGDYVARASNSYGVIFSDKATISVTNLTTPAGLVSNAISSSRIDLNWTAGASAATGFKIERATSSGGPWTLAAAVTSSTTYFANTGLATNTLYYYRVKSTNSGFDSAPSNIASATTQAAATATHTLTVNSVNPASGAYIYVIPNDVNGAANGSTPLAPRVFNNHTSVALVAASVVSGKPFIKWQRDGVDNTTNNLVYVTMDADHTMTAVYGSAGGVRTLTGLGINGPASVAEKTSQQYTATAYFSDGSSMAVAPIVWVVVPSASASMSNSGLLDAGAVTSDTAVSVSTSYLSGGVLQTASKPVTITHTNTSQTYTLNVNTTGSGSVVVTPNGRSFESGTVVHVFGQPESGYKFSYWSGDASGTDDDANVTMTGNRSVTANFIVDPSIGSLTVNLSPALAVTEGAQWKYRYFTDWRASGNTQGNIPVGNGYVHFKDIPGWTAPAEVQAPIVAGQPATVNATYTEILGAVQVTITPAQAAAAGARWRLDGGAWTESGVTLANASTGAHTVEFLPIAGWATPPGQSISVARGIATTRTGDYGPPAGLPIITSISPRTGPIAGGTTVTIDGANFLSGATVSFGGVAAASVTVVSPTRVTAVTPARASYGSVALALTSGGQTVTQANGFSYLNALGSNIELVGQIGGSVDAIAVVGNTVYYNEGTGFVVSDFTNSAAPVERGRITLPDFIKDIAVVNNIAFVATVSAGLYAVDVSAPTAPSIVGFFDTEIPARGVAVSGGIAYVTCGDYSPPARLEILDVSNPAAIVRLGQFPLLTASNADRISVGTIGSRKYAFVAEDYSSGGGPNPALRAIDVTTPSAPVEVSNIPAQSFVGITDVKIVGTKLFVSDQQSGIKIFDASNPATLAQTGLFYPGRVWA